MGAGASTCGGGGGAGRGGDDVTGFEAHAQTIKTSESRIMGPL